MNRVIAYIDGFNLYFGLKADHGRKYLWLDLQALACCYRIKSFGGSGTLRPGCATIRMAAGGSPFTLTR